MSESCEKISQQGTNISEFDIVISGGGLIGATLALVLAEAIPSYTIAIVEPVPLKSDAQPSFDSRCLAIAQSSKQLLASFGLWPALRQYAQPIEHIHVSDRGHIGKTYLHADRFNFSALGYVLEVQDIGNVLADKLSQTANVHWFSPNKIAALETFEQHQVITLDDGQIISAKLLLGADGGNSSTRKLLNIDCRNDDYEQMAVIANVGIKDSHQNWAYERFTEFGPIALLPMNLSPANNARYSLVWCQNSDNAKQLMASTAEQFIDKLQQAFGFRAGQFVEVSKPVCYPLVLSLAEDMVAHRAALVGNSSHTIHPIAGQGFNLGLRDIAALSSILSKSDSSELGTFGQLHRYNNARSKDLSQVVNMTDALVRLFSNDSRLMALGRTVGLLTMQMIDDLKFPLGQQAMGFNGASHKVMKP